MNEINNVHTKKLKYLLSKGLEVKLVKNIVFVGKSGRYLTLSRVLNYSVSELILFIKEYNYPNNTFSSPLNNKIPDRIFLEKIYFPPGRMMRFDIGTLSC